MPIWMTISFQDSNSPLMEHMVFFHDHTMVVIITITIMVGYLLLSSINSDSFSSKNQEHTEMEIFWTILPAGLLIFIALPSMKILYLTDEMNSTFLMIKTMGNQWYWSYEYSDLKNLQFDSFMLNGNEPRLLCTSNHLIIPSKTPIQMLVSSNDVIHSWTIPSLGVKADAVPGRLNQLFMISNRTGIMTGQCSEICGINHSFMPIMISSIPPNIFIKSIELV
uniref:Cytochrome c oxidase subunit 2 n=1 Tax=Hygrobates longiporus TaxID=2740590 RepID=A0A6J4EFL1_9ACAR|nr:cytochrome oxidase subunit 2 [Hygrobates longiporus]BCG28119.1 cytochrome oxidase subunit 2 [Hygrobates longiporus]